MFEQVCKENLQLFTVSGYRSAQQFPVGMVGDGGVQDLLDDVPVMSATVLGLELLKHAMSVDVRSAASLILSDVGAVIQVLRLVGREYGCRADRPRRMSECIASLDMSDLVATLSIRTFPSDTEHKDLASVWKQCRLVAQYAFLMAESFGAVNPEDAYLVGLLHDEGSLAKVLGWKGAGPGQLLAQEGLLPSFAVSALGLASHCPPLPAWNQILSGAHELARVPGISFDSPRISSH